MKARIFLVTGLVILIIYLAYPFLIPPPPPEAGTSIIIHKDINRLYFYQDGSLNGVYKVATGKDPSLTPEGDFKIVVKEADPSGLGTDAIFGTRWMGLNVPGHRDGLKYGIHGTNEPSSIGHHASAGCIRMATADIETLYPKIPLNTSVYIKRGTFLHRYIYNLFAGNRFFQ